MAATLIEIALFLYPKEITNDELAKKCRYCKFKALEINNSATQNSSSSETIQSALSGNIQHISPGNSQATLPGHNLSKSPINREDLSIAISAEKNLRYAMNAIQYDDFSEAKQLLLKTLELIDKILQNKNG